jgi:transglutaminase-like putative cysteine protease
MNRRDFIRCASAGAATTTLGWPGDAFGQKTTSTDDGWRLFEITTHVEVLRPTGATRVWIPVPLRTDAPYQKLVSTQYGAVGGKVSLIKGTADRPEMVRAEWPVGVKPEVSLTCRVRTHDRAVDIRRPRAVAANAASLARFTKPSSLLPLDGIVKTTADEITRGAATDLDKARAIYEWIVDKTFRDPKVRGCGVGDIRFMLESRNLGGKCADLNALFVGLARAAGLPARDVYGLRVAPSNHGLKSLGAASENVSKAQHCRAEVHLEGYGWVPVDPADVRKVVLEEPPGNHALTDEVVRSARARLFGSWEMNWIAYNVAHDVALPGSTGRALGFFMYPHGETADGRLDSLDSDAFSYRITAHEV